MITVITPLSRDHDIGALRILLTFVVTLVPLGRYI